MTKKRIAILSFLALSIMAVYAATGKLDLKSAALINDIVEVFYRHTDKK